MTMYSLNQTLEHRINMTVMTGGESLGGGYSSKNRVWLCAALKITFSSPPGSSLRPPFPNNSVPQEPTFI